MMSQLLPVFIQCCDEKIGGPFVMVNINHIVIFAKHTRFSENEQWYRLSTSCGRIFYTLYNLPSLSIYMLPSL